jgi:hypothetical protein
MMPFGGRAKRLRIQILPEPASPEGQLPVNVAPAGSDDVSTLRGVQRSLEVATGRDRATMPVALGNVVSTVARGGMGALPLGSA